MQKVSEQFVGFRLPRVLLDKLDNLANETGRNRSEILRLLVFQAAARAQCDVYLEELAKLERWPAVGEAKK